MGTRSLEGTVEKYDNTEYRREQVRRKDEDISTIYGGISHWQEVEYSKGGCHSRTLPSGITF